MITIAANRFSDYLKSLETQNRSYATNSACDYANTDNPSSKEAYARYSKMADTLYDLHIKACQAFHSVESEMSQRVKDELGLKENP